MATRRNKTIGQLIDASLDFYGVKSGEDGLNLFGRARARSKLDDKQAMAVATEEVFKVRAERRKP